MEKRIEKIEEDIKQIRDNHLVHIKQDIAGVKEDLGSVKADVAGVKEDLVGVRLEVVEVKTNVGWLIDNHKMIRNAIFATLITGIIGALIGILK